MELPAPLVAEILAALEQPRSAAASPDQRRQPRYEHPATLLVTPWPQPEGQHPDTFSVTIRNCSVYGIAILHNHPMTRGQQFVVSLLNQGSPTTAILCTVAHSRRINPETHVIGAEFTRLLSAQSMQALSA
jgi:hypothetical protein